MRCAPPELTEVAYRRARVCWAQELRTSDMPLDEADVGVAFEPEANHFARHLLVPRPWLEGALDRGWKVPDLARRFGVSQNVIWLAMEGYKLI